MKILAFADLHSSMNELKKLEAKIQKSKPDAILCAGDFTVFQQNIKDIMKRMNKFGCKVYLIHGNHEISSKVKSMCTKYKNLEFVHKKIVKLNDAVLVSHGGGGFTRKDKDFDNFMRKNKAKLKGKEIILMTHAPPYNTKLDSLVYVDDHVGCESYRKFIEKYQPKYAISGHIHETFNQKDKIGESKLINPGPKGVIIKV